MGWPVPRFTRMQVNRAGIALVTNNATEAAKLEAQDVLNNWRACHGYPINTFQATLRMKLKHIDRHAIVAQRLKREPGIIFKLRRFDKMDLARMQDIGGLRAVVSSIPNVKRLTDEYEHSHFDHELHSKKDYIL